MAALLGLSACLPSEDLSSYSSSYGRAEPAIALEGPAPEGAAPSVGGGAAPELAAPNQAPPSPAAPGEPCNGDCITPDLPLLIDAGSPAALAPSESGGSVAPADARASAADAGVPLGAVPLGAVPLGAVPLGAVPVDAVPVDAGAPGPCGQSALLADERCFALITTASTWSDARDACEARGAGWDLAVIRSDERNTSLAEMLSGVTDAWVGANDLAQEGSWRWVGDPNPFFTGTGTAGSAAAGAFVNWNTGGTPEPNGGAASDCLRLRANGGWADIACTSTFAALCEGPQP